MHIRSPGLTGCGTRTMAWFGVWVEYIQQPSKLRTWKSDHDLSRRWLTDQLPMEYRTQKSQSLLSVSGWVLDAGSNDSLVQCG